MVVWCKYCYLPIANGPIANGNSVQCQSCNDSVHFNCLQREKPSRMEGDVLFDFTCKNCGEDGEEQLSRTKITWLQAIHLALYNLSVRESGRQGFFRWKDDICAFLSQHWSALFPERPMTNNWRSTVAGTLSVYCAKLFKSGQAVFNEAGWWALMEVKPPPKNYGSYVKAKQNTKSKDLKRKLEETDEDQSFGRGKRTSKIENCVADSELNLNGSQGSTMELDFDDESLGSADIQTNLNSLDFNVNRDYIEDIVPTDDPFSLLKVEDLGKELSHCLQDSSTLTSTSSDTTPTVVESFDRNAMNNSSEETQGIKEQLMVKSQQSPLPVRGNLTHMNSIQEREVLNKLNSCFNAITENPVAMRLRRKLKLRKRKIEMGLPLFDLDDRVRQLIRRSAPTGVEITFTDARGNEVSETAKETDIKENHQVASSLHHPALQGINVLDRFRTCFRSTPRNVPNSFSYHSFLSRLVGCNDDIKLRPICSPYTQRVLKPFIRRDFETKPLRVKLMEELIAFTHRYDQHWITPCPSPIDYCYVQPHHIPAVNAMCEDFFWTGINLSECLQYPDFSCVVLYKKLLIGFAFMVPDVKYNEAYISFILVHPDWRGAGIGTFMLYHLIQTCMGKDVTLHVSASNPSIMLYQKFGFKAEEFILDFYDKYLPEDSLDSKHAFFLRLQR